MKIEFKCGCKVETNTYDLLAVDIINVCETHSDKLDDTEELDVLGTIDPNIVKCEW